jgi:hypothetical protein
LEEFNEWSIRHLKTHLKNMEEKRNPFAPQARKQSRVVVYRSAQGDTEESQTGSSLSPKEVYLSPSTKLKALVYTDAALAPRTCQPDIRKTSQMKVLLPSHFQPLVGDILETKLGKIFHHLMTASI